LSAHFPGRNGCWFLPVWVRQRNAKGEPDLLLWDAGLHGVIALAVAPEVHAEE
jgi:hypothetical protein